MKIYPHRLFFTLLNAMLLPVLALPIANAADRVAPEKLEVCRNEFALLVDQSGGSVRKLPNGYWTKDTIAYWILEMQRKGLDLNYHALSKYKPDELHAAGIPIRTESMRAKANQLFDEGWDGALRYAGLNPARIMRHQTNWTREMLLEQLKYLDEQGIPMNVKLVKANKKRIENGKISFTLSGLYQAARRQFGNWPKALKAAGVTVKPLPRSIWNDKLIREQIKLLTEAGYPMNSSFFSHWGKNITIKTGDIEYNLGALRSAAVREFGNWYEALQAAKVDLTKARTLSGAGPPSRSDRGKWNRDRVLSQIGILYEKGKLKSVTEIRNGENTTHNIDGIEYTDVSLLNAATRRFGSWKNAVKAAGIDYNKIALVEMDIPRHDWKQEEILSEIRLLHKEGLLQSTHRIRSSKPKLIERSDKKYRLYDLVRSASDDFGSWRDAVRAASIDYDNLLEAKPLIPIRGEWSEETVLRELRSLYKERKLRSWTAVVTDPAENITRADIEYTESQLLKIAGKYFSSWSNATRAAGIDYSLIRHNRSVRHQLLAEAQQGEWIDGKFVVHMGEAAPSPEEVFVQAQQAQQIEAALEKQGATAGRYMEGIIEYLDYNESFADLAALAKFLSEKYETEVTKEEAERILTELAANPKLRAIFEEL